MDNSNFGGFHTPLNPKRLQSQLGKETRRLNREGKNSVRLILARVLKVNYRFNTVDVMTINEQDTFIRNPLDNGKFSARLPVSFGGRTSNGDIYGENTLVTVGSMVLVGFLDGSKDKPIVINIYGELDHQSQLTKTSFTGADDSEEELQKELWSIFSLYPSMTYKSRDGRGNVEETFSGRSFMYVTDSDPENDYVNDVGFDYQDLPNSKYADGKPIEPKSAASPTLLYVHQGVYDDHRVTFFIKADGTLRVGSRHVEGTGITFQEMNPDGSFAIVQKKDTDRPEDESEKFSEFRVTEEGHIILASQRNKVEITDRGVFVNGGRIDGGFEQQIKNLEEGLIDSYLSMGILGDEIELKAGQLEVDELTLEVTDQRASLILAHDAIKTSVTKTEFAAMIDGTSNILTRTAFEELPTPYGEGTTMEIYESGDVAKTLRVHRQGASEAYGIYVGDYSPVSIDYETPYTLTFEGNFDNITELNFLYVSTDTGLVEKIPNVDIVVTEEPLEEGEEEADEEQDRFTKYEVTFETEEEYKETAYILIAVEGVESDSFDIRKIQLEEGDEATEWRMSYLDYAIMRQFRTGFDQLAESLALTADSLEKDIDGIDIRVRDTELKVTPEALTQILTSSEVYLEERQELLESVEGHITPIRVRLNEVEERTTAESIITTMTSSLEYKSSMEGKADLGLLEGFTTQEELDEWLGAIDDNIYAQITGIDFTPYVQTKELYDAVDAWELRFSKTGGMNLLQNSVGFAKSDFWNPKGEGVTPIRNSDLDKLGFGSGFQFSPGFKGTSILYQDVPTIPKIPYTLSWQLRKLAGTEKAGFWVQVYRKDGTTLIAQEHYQAGVGTKGYENKSMVIEPVDDKVRIRVVGDEKTDATITGLMFNIGDIALQWSLATGELYNAHTRIDMSGIRVSQFDEERIERGFTQITPDEFAGYYDSAGLGHFDKIFYLNKDETVTKRLRTREELSMGSMRIKNENVSGRDGWAFGPIEGQPILFIDANKKSLGFNGYPQGEDEFLINGQLVLGESRTGKVDRGLAFLRTGAPNGSTKASDYDNLKVRDGRAQLNGDVIFSTEEEILWSGTQLMSSEQVITPLRKLSDCPNGWTLVWSRYSAGGSVDSFWNYTDIPKRSSTFVKGGGTTCIVYGGSSDAQTAEAMMKYILTTETTIRGHASNIATELDRSICLRYVLAY